MDESNVLKISVYNSDAGRKFNLYVREDRYKAFQEFVLHRRLSGEYQLEASGMPGLSWFAIMGLDAIFDRRPKSFPVRDIVLYLASAIITNGSGVSAHEIEKALEAFSAVYPPDVSGDA